MTKILIADNDLHFRASLKDILEAHGYQVFSAASPEEAKQVLQKELIHLAVLDIRLTDDDDPQDASGLQLSEEIDPAIARIILTAYPPPGMSYEAFPSKVRIPLAGRFLMVYMVSKLGKQEVLLEAVKKAIEEDFEIIPERRIALLTSGGDSPGMNAAVWAVVRTAMNNEVEVIGVQDGFQGLADDQMYKLSWNYVSSLMEQGGTALGTARFPNFKDKSVRDRAVANIISKAITGLIVIGGDGSMNGAQALARDLAAQGKTLQTIAIPGTIDNDLWGTDMSLGAASAANAMINQIRNMIRPAQALRRVFVVEVMGACCGYLALQSALGIGADAVLIPETLIEVAPNTNPTDPASWRDRVMLIETQQNILQQLKEVTALLEASFEAGKRFGFVILAEGVSRLTRRQVNKEFIQNSLDNMIQRWPHPNRPDVRAQELGYPVRGVPPIRFDIWLGARLGTAAVERLLDGKTNVMVGWSEERGVIETPYSEVIEKSNRPPREVWAERPKWQEMLAMQEALACPPKLRSQIRARGNRFIRVR